MPNKPFSKTVGVRFDQETLERIRGYRSLKDIDNDSDAVRELLFKGLAFVARETDKAEAAWDSGYANGRSEGLRVVMRAMQKILATHTSELKLFAALIRTYISDLERRAADE